MSPALQPGVEFASGHRLEPVAVAEVGVGEPFDAGDVFGGDVAQRRPQLTDPVAGQRVEDPGAVAAGSQEHRLGPCARRWCEVLATL